MKNSDKIILDLCGGSGAWSKPYKDAGYNVHVITLPDYDICKVSLNDSYMVFPHNKDSNLDLFIPMNDVYGILAAPVCTCFSKANWRVKKED